MRCLLFSSNPESIHPIWPVLADLGIEGEYCQTAVDAVEKVTTQNFEIVVTNWEDQPEAAFLLKTARDLKAAQRPLTLAIVSDDGRRPEALQAGANSILLKPLRPEQVRDTLSTACELLRAKLQSAATPQEPTTKAAFSAAASSDRLSAPGPALKSPEQAPAKVLPQSANSGPEALAEKELAVNATEERRVAKDGRTQPETSSSLEASSPPQIKTPETLTGWAMLQSRLTASAPRPATGAGPKNALLAYGDPSYGTGADGSGAENDRISTRQQSRPEDKSEAALFTYISGKSAQNSGGNAPSKTKRGKLFTAVAVVAVCGTLAALPRTRQTFQTVYRNGVRIGNRLLNPPPAPLPQAVEVHDSFGQSGDEYKLPVATAIPDATTDPSQIRVLPVIDPTAKPQKNGDANSGTEQSPAVESPAPEQSPLAPDQNSQGTPEGKDVKASAPGSPEHTPDNPPEVVPAVMSTQPLSAPVSQRSPVSSPQHPLTLSSALRPHATSAATAAGIPSSLKSQVASTTPQSSGAKPIEAALSSIEPVSLPEPVAREQLSQPVEPVYPAAAKAAGQRGSVTLQVLIARDGGVADAKFLQGSLVFARSAIDAVKQWRFRPYLLNGRAVSVQSVITLTFKPPA